MPNMKDVVRCPKCGSLEYFGMLHWMDGKEMCRPCIYSIWENESQWKRDFDEDYVFPLYEDGNDYTINKEEDQDGTSNKSI